MHADLVRAAVDDALRGGCFFVAPPGQLRVAHVEDEIVPWEVFRGHLLDGPLARQRVAFEAWHVLLDRGLAPAAAPLISIHWQRDEKRIHVTRRILTRGFEAYEDSPGVILNRGVQKWVAELVATIELADFQVGALRSELGINLFLAVVGTSRLPITSLESPLPAFSLGQLAYVPGLSENETPWTDPIALLRATLDGHSTAIERAKALETALRAASGDELPKVAAAIVERAGRRASDSGFASGLFRDVFNQVALSPYTRFAEHLVNMLQLLSTPERLGARAVIDVLGDMLRHLCRHLTGFDLTLFHNLGANYPDALFLDCLLKAYLRLIDECPELFLTGSGDTVAAEVRKRRRALRQACLVRKQYEGHRVPDVPTSLGENVRVVSGIPQVPEEQILQTATRRRKLFDGRPLEGLLSATSRRALDESCGDLRGAIELRELGVAYFLDRPLGAFKQSGEPDRTPLLSYQAYSRSIVKRRLSQLKSAGWITSDQREQCAAAADRLSVPGLAATAISAAPRPGVVSLADAHGAAPDFVFLRTTRGSLDELLVVYDLRPLARVSSQLHAWLKSDDSVLLVSDPPHGPDSARLKFYDRAAKLRLELGFAAGTDRMIHYRVRGGVEFAERLQVLSIGDAQGDEPHAMRDVRDQSLALELKDEE